MILNIGLGLLIFGYAGWTLVRYIRKTKQGKCAGCALSETCQTGCSTVMPIKPADPR
ncbi:FeoB-associated Cys-rich membrane protein [Cohnella nanjingensis]|uniref:FeoB-associated Cys-rich membrane protein n=1 Tax=Cohnella nanjingensis TaxID=1387779 RepID=A0A7X0VF34_9BACL|nr:FeoB-associated Cys-rich membrane protein [Cohnella nanjingensis]MBB6671396.1 FeoB-associated Cys-rich membrane protein [Cohnella nanjingensis]